MTHINPDLNKQEYEFTPRNCLTALFEAGTDYRAVLQSLRDLGFNDDQLVVFVGNTGANQIDLAAEHQSAVIKMTRALDQVFSDQTELLQLANQTLKEGGILMRVQLDDDDSRKSRVAETMKESGGFSINHWGQWAIEGF